LADQKGSNVDRLLAIWQRLNWNMWFDKPWDGDPAPTSPLLPFHYDTNKSPWSSDRCRDWTVLNYNYDDLVPKPDALNPDGSINQTRYLQDLRAHINDLYPGTSDAIKATPGYTLEGGKFNDYIINVIYDRYALNGRAYTILFFIGDPPKALSGYRQSDSFVGLVYTFSAPIEITNGSTACGNCAQQQSDKVLSKAQIPITLPLLAKANPPPGLGLGALDPGPVEEILRQKLTWEFVELGGRRRSASDFPNTEIAVLHGQGSHATERGQLATYEGYKKLLGATQDKPLGSGNPDTQVNLIRDDV
jgi:tyrosinase